MFRILIAGYYGFDNLGDEAVLTGLIKGLRDELPGVEIAALSENPEKTRALHGITAIKRTDLLSIFLIMCKSDIFLFGGGSLVQDATSILSPFYYFGLLMMARCAKLPYMLIAQGVGPLNRSSIKKITACNFNRAKLITVRDEKSADLLIEIGVKTDIQITADLALLLEQNNSPRVAEWIAKNIPTDKKIICISMRPWQSDGSLAVTRVTTAIKKNSDIFPIYLPMQPAMDNDISNAMLQETGGAMVDFSPTPAEAIAIIAACHGTIAMRLHTLILSVRAGIPAFGIIYDPKVRDFCKKANIAAAEINDELSSSIQLFLNSNLQHLKVNEALINAAKKNIQIITDYLKRKKK